MTGTGLATLPPQLIWSSVPLNPFSLATETCTGYAKRKALLSPVLRPSALEETSLVLNAETVLPIAYLMRFGPAYGLLGMSVSTAKAVDAINAIPNARGRLV